MTGFCEEAIQKFPDVIDITDSKIEKLQVKLKNLLPKGMHLLLCYLVIELLGSLYSKYVGKPIES